MTEEILKKKIAAATDLKEIISLMKLLSSVNIGHYDNALASLKLYRATIDLAFQGLSRTLGRTPVAKEQPPRRVLIVLIGSEGGLVGAFNRTILTAADTLLSSWPNARAFYMTLGRRMSAVAARKKPLSPGFSLSGVLKEMTSVSAAVLAQINTHVATHKIDSVFLVFNEKKTGTALTVRTLRLLPPAREEADKADKKGWPGRMQPLIATNPATLSKELMQEHLIAVLTHALIASGAAENFARMTAMGEAEKNIEKRLDEMTLSFQQARQNAVTEELTDIISATQSLEKTLFREKKRKKNLTIVLKKAKKHVSKKNERKKNND